METTVREYVAILTPEEREQHKELINECLAREATINETAASRQQTTEKLINSLSSFKKRIEVISDTAQQGSEVAQKSLRTAQQALKANKEVLSKIRTFQLKVQKPTGSA